MVRVIFSAAIVAISMIAFTPAHATRSLDDVLARLEALEKENATLRKRLQRLEATERERPAVASLPATSSAPSARAARTAPALPSTARLTPAASQAFAMSNPVEVRNWTGAYLGLSGGMRREDHTWTTNSFGDFFAAIPNSQDFNDTSARFGGFAGYNYQLTPKLVAGIEADFAWGKTKTGTSHGIPGTGGLPFPLMVNDTSSFETGWDASLRARIGALVTPDTLVYLTGGAAWQRITAGVTCDANSFLVCATQSHSDTLKSTLTGWTFGAGVESMLAGAWTGRIEYRYSQYGNLNHLFIPLPGCLCEGNLDTTISLSTHTFIAGIAYKIGGY